MLHGALLLLVPSVPVIALGLWWNGNTVSHNFIHLPFFRSRIGNKLFSAFLSLLLGLPQSFWKAKHLAHHGNVPFRWKPIRREWIAEGALVLLLWSGLATFAPRFLVTVYLPGWLLGLGLCQLQGYFEHARGTLSHYGQFYNWLFFNDGYHVEHHAQPGRHWRTLPRAPRVPAVKKALESNVSRWPAVLRWLEFVSLDGLEELVCRSPRLQRFVLQAHERAFAKILRKIPSPQRVVIVGGGMFPRTALILQRLVPDAELILIEARQDRLQRAKGWLSDEIKCVRMFCTATNLFEFADEADLVIVPLALRGHKAEFYEYPPAPYVLVHDWIWRSRGQSVVLSWLLLKRLNMVRAASFAPTGNGTVGGAPSRSNGQTVPGSRPGTSPRDVPARVGIFEQQPGS
jgi:hypothetical protein